MEPKAKQSTESVVKEIKRNTRRKFNSEEKIRIILEGLRGEETHLFAAIYDEKHISMNIQYSATLFDAYVEELARNPKLAGLARDKLRYFQFLAWIFVQGIASLKPWIEETEGKLDKASLIKLIRDGSKILTYGFIENQTRSSVKKKGNLKKLVLQKNPTLTCYETIKK